MSFSDLLHRSIFPFQIHKICKPWLKEVNSPSANAEVKAFLAGPEFKQVVHDVSKRLGFQDDLPFGTEYYFKRFEMNFINALVY